MTYTSVLTWKYTHHTLYTLIPYSSIILHHLAHLFTRQTLPLWLIVQMIFNVLARTLSSEGMAGS